jgi:tetratricopeptide (TPR) repeat protein
MSSPGLRSQTRFVAMVVVMAGVGLTAGPSGSTPAEAQTLAISQSTAARSNDPARLALDGEAALKERRYDDALASFSAAARLVPGDASLQLLTGYSAYMLGQFATAREPLERALALNPKLTNASTMLAGVLYRLGKVTDAVRTLEAAQKYAPADKEVADLLARWKPEAKVQNDSYEARGAHFSVRFQGPADDLVARRILELLEDAYRRVGGVLASYPTEPVTVMLYTQEQFRASSNAPDWAVASFDGRIKIPTVGALQKPEELKSTLTHEFVHAVVAELAGGSAPKWLNEGLAELLQSDDYSRIERVLARVPKRLPLSQLERDFGALAADDVPLAYAQSAMAVRKMIDLRGATAVAALLQALGRGDRFDRAFEATIFMRYEDFAATVARY